MEAMQNLPEKIEVKRGGSAHYFIYLLILVLFGMVNTVFKIPPPYLYYVFMAIGVVAVLSMNKLTGAIFTKVIIRATKEGIWTSKLNLVPWSQIKDIRIEKASTFNTGNMTSSVSIDLIIETKDSRESNFWGGFLNTDPTLLSARLNKLWQTFKWRVFGENFP
jgi:hypothetical protein